MGELEAAAGKAQPAIGRIDLLDGAARRDLRMIDHLLDLPDAGAGRAGGLQDLLPLARVLLRQRLLDDGAQRRLVLLAGEPVDEARVLQRIGAAERGHQRAVLLLAVDGEQQIAVARLEQIGGRPAADRLVAGQLLAMAGDRRSPRPAPTGTPASPPAWRRRPAAPCRYGCAGTARSTRRTRRWRPTARRRPQSPRASARSRRGR